MDVVDARVNLTNWRAAFCNIATSSQLIRPTPCPYFPAHDFGLAGHLGALATAGT